MEQSETRRLAPCLLFILTLVGFICLLLVLPASAADAPAGGDATDPLANYAPADLAPEPVSIWGLLFRVVSMLLGICAAIYGVFWFIAKKGRVQAGRHGVMRLVDTLPLGQNRFVGIIEVGERYFVVGVAEHGVTPVAELGPDELQHLAKRDGDIAPPSFTSFMRDRFGKRAR